MELRQLTTFRMVATTLSFTRTAETLNYAQSSVTAQIQALEEELGVPLFDRLGKRVVLTDAGQRLLGYADKLLDLSEEARAAVSGGADPAGSLAISAPETLCTYFLPPILRRFRGRFPEVKLLIRCNVTTDLHRSATEGALDLAFLLQEPLVAPDFLVEHLVTMPLLLLAPPEHSLTQLASVRAADLKDQTVVLTEIGCGYRQLFERTLANAGVRPASTIEFSSVEAIKQCVMAGMGITILPAVAVATEVAQGRLAALKWSGPDFQAVIQMAWHKDKWLSPALSAFLDVTREVLQGRAVESTAGGKLHDEHITASRLSHRSGRE